MTFVGYDLHTRMPQVALLDTGTGEVSKRRLPHDGMAVEDFYAALPRPVTIGIESAGYAVWFHTLMQRFRQRILRCIENTPPVLSHGPSSPRVFPPGSSWSA